MAIKTDDVLKQIEDNIKFFLPGVKQEANQLKYYIDSLRPEVDEAIATGDLMSLSFLKDRIIGRTARASLGIIHRERKQVIVATVTTIRTAVAFLMAAA